MSGLPFSRLSQQRGSRKDAVTQSDDSGRHFPRCVRRTCPQVLWLTRRRRAAHCERRRQPGPHWITRRKENKVAMSAIRNMKASWSCCFRLVNQSSCGHGRWTQRGKWHPESSDCVLSTAALLGKTRERQPAHSRPRSPDWNRALCACAQSTASGDIHKGT